MAHTPFRGGIPNDRLYCPRHDMWVRKLDDGSGEVQIGATRFGIFLAGEVIAFTAKPTGATIAVGRGMGTIECRKTVLAVHAPLSFVLLEGNAKVEDDPRAINLDPYGAGWMARGRTTGAMTEWAELIDAAAYRAHILGIEPEACFED